MDGCKMWWFNLSQSYFEQHYCWLYVLGSKDVLGQIKLENVVISAMSSILRIIYIIGWMSWCSKELQWLIVHAWCGDLIHLNGMPHYVEEMWWFNASQIILQISNFLDLIVVWPKELFLLKYMLIVWMDYVW